MSLYLNINTKEYPRYNGDLELLGWSEGNPLPEGWVQVVETDIPTFENDETFNEAEPQEVNGVWMRTWNVRKLTEEELAARLALEEDLLAVEE
jgi:hypothetical protein